MTDHSTENVKRMNSEPLSLGPLIKRYRKEKGISQENLARNAGIDRTTVARVECGKFKTLSVGKLSGIAGALGVDVKMMLATSASSGESVTYRGQVGHVEFSLDYPDQGFRIESLLPKRKEFFFGRLEVSAQKTIDSSNLPHPEQVFLHCLEGKLVVNRDTRECLLKPGDCFAFSGISDYELYNPDQMKHTKCLFITYPSFL
jgi:transcriptional regulator with XRE-family HTH domain